MSNIPVVRLIGPFAYLPTIHPGIKRIWIAHEHWQHSFWRVWKRVEVNDKAVGDVIWGKSARGQEASKRTSKQEEAV